MESFKQRLAQGTSRVTALAMDGLRTMLQGNELSSQFRREATTEKRGYASNRGNIRKHCPYGKILKSFTTPDGYEISLHATKGYRVRRNWLV